MTDTQTESQHRRSGDGEYEITEEHKQAMAEGREQSRIVSAYLEALETYRPQRGRKPSPDRLREKLVEINTLLDGEDLTPIQRLDLVAERERAEKNLERISNEAELDDLQRDFVNVASAYADRKNISYKAFREVGVPAAVLKEAGVK